MKLLTPSEPILGDKEIYSYVMDDVNCGEFLGLTYKSKVTDIEYPRYDPAKGDQYNRILVERPGGYGDIIFCGPMLEQIRKASPQAEICFSCAPRFRDGVVNNPNVDEVVPYPVRHEQFLGYDAVIWLENLVEMSPEGRTMHCVDLYLMEAGFDWESIPADQKRNQLYLSTYDLSAKERFPRNEKNRVGIQLKASARCRTASDWDGVVNGMADKGWEVFLFGAPGEVTISGANERGIINLTNQDPKLSFLQSAAVMQTCDLMICPDSGLLHVAGAFDIPAIGVYAAFRSDLRCKYSPKTECIQVHGGCAPCFWHGRNGGFPPMGGCVGQGRCPALDSVTPDRIIDEAIAWWEKCKQ